MRDQEGESEPAHHARRPMNAFLIFCKRHRSVVRDKYPNLENRSITKILGEWWANLEEDDKSCYTSLAKQYKDAFFNANPDFKWYKLPAPPLRTLSSRPRDNGEKHVEAIHCDYADPDPVQTNNNSTRIDFNRRNYEQDEPKALSVFTPGKLADEAQMGSLSSLLEIKTENQTQTNPYYSSFSYNYTLASYQNQQYQNRSQLETEKIKIKSEDSIRELQNELSEASKIFEDFDEDQSRPYNCGPRNDQFTNQEIIDQVVEKRYSTDDYDSRNWIDYDRHIRSGRSCKGKRYQEFMAVGGLLVNKRQKRDYSDKVHDEPYTPSCSWEEGIGCYEETASEEKDKKFEENDVASDEPTEEDTNQTDNSNKTFKAADFDLDAKIRALPSLSLEKFQQRKKENKRKKKTVNLKMKHNSSQMRNSFAKILADDRREMAKNVHEAVVGSQKRKPRKISITRLEINSLVTNHDYCNRNKISPEIKIATEAPYTVVSNIEVCRQETPGDLFALATLAEVAANTSRIDETAISQNMAANIMEEETSTI